MEYTEVLDKQITRKQHYVPKAYLKNFSVSNRKSEQVYVVFANDENAKMVSIDNICCRSYLYDQIAIDPDSKTHVFAAPNEIENSFIELEGEYATIISKIKNALRDSDEFELARVEIDKLRQCHHYCLETLFLYICQIILLIHNTKTIRSILNM